MLTSVALLKLQQVLAANFKVGVLGTEDAFPTAGHTFVRLYALHTEIQRFEQFAHFTIKLGITTYVRTRQFPIQKRSTPYITLLDLTERIVFFLISDQTIANAVTSKHPRISLLSTVPKNYIFQTKPVPVLPREFGSDDQSSIREAGYKLAMSFTLPTLQVPLACFDVPGSLSQG